MKHRDEGGMEPVTGHEATGGGNRPMSEADKRALRSAFGQFATGVTIITARTAEGQDIGITANSFSSVSLEPPLLLWSLALTSQSIDAFVAGFPFAITILSDEQEALARHFGRSGTDQFALLPQPATIEHNHHGVPLIRGGIATFECVVEQVVPAGDHNVLISRIERFETHAGAPLLFFGGRFLSA